MMHSLFIFFLLTLEVDVFDFPEAPAMAINKCNYCMGCTVLTQEKPIQAMPSESMSATIPG